MAKSAFILAAIAASALGYALYFDYQRHHSKEFRMKLKKENKKQKKLQELEKKSQPQFQLLQQALAESLEAEPLPDASADIAGSRQYFTTQIAKAESLAAVPGKALDAAICFYRALVVYPSPTDILSVYQNSIPSAIYELVVQLVAVKPPPIISEIIDTSSANEAD